MLLLTPKPIDVELSPMHGFQAEKQAAAIDKMTTNTLLENLMEDSKIAFFLRTSGIIFPNESDESYYRRLQYAWSFLVQLFVLFMFGFGIFFFSFNIGSVNSGTDDSYAHADSLSMACIGLALSSQAAILLPSIPKMIARLNSPVATSDLKYYTKSIFLSRFVYYVSMLLGYVILFETYCNEGNQSSTTCTGVSIPYLTAFQALGHIGISCLLAVNCMFVQVDCFASVANVELLLHEHEEKTLTIDKFNHCRADIQIRVDSNYWTYNATMVVGMLDVVLIIVLLFVDNVNPLFCMAFVKEIPFIFVAAYYAMTVNEKSDLLTKALGTATWTKEDIEADHNRIFFYSNADANKISFPLAGMRFTRKDLILKVAASALAFAIGLARTAVASG